MLTVDVYARDRGWLFEDLKGHFRAADVPGVRVVDSPEPLPPTAADAWICLRTAEASASPDRERTAVQVADLFDDGIYLPGGARAGVRGAGGLLLIHPGQRAILEGAGVCLEGVAVLDRPQGALSSFTTRTELPPSFHVGWVGRGHPRKRVEWFVEAMVALDDPSATAVLLGEGLAEAADRLRSAGVGCRHLPRHQHPIADYPDVYRSLDCLVVTSETEAGPFVLFEALACGVPVVSTPVGWAPLLAATAPRYVRIAADAGSVAAELRAIGGQRAALFAERAHVSRLVERWRLEDWVTEAVRLAAGLATGGARPAATS